MDKHLFGFYVAFIASMGTFIGGLLVVFMEKLFKRQLKSKANNLVGIFQAFSAGVMVYMTFLDLVPESTAEIGPLNTMMWFFVGVFGFMVLEEMVPEPSPKKKSKKQESLLERTSFITFIALALHNLPEGLSVYLSSLSNRKLGIQLGVGIMLHNIPEGMAVAIPLWAAKKPISHVLLMTFLNGLAEPIGVVVGGFLLSPYLSQQILSKCLAAVGGIMACISIHELIPMSIHFSGKSVMSICFFVGMFVCFVALESVEILLPGILL